MIERFELEGEGYHAWLRVWCHASRLDWHASFTWRMETVLGADGITYGHDRRDRAICAVMRKLLKSLDKSHQWQIEIDRQLNNVQRQQMGRIRKWAEGLRRRHQPATKTSKLDKMGSGA